MKKHIFLWYSTIRRCFILLIFVVSLSLLIGCTKKIQPTPEHVHNRVHVLRREPTCIQEGCIEYWYCSQCGKLFSERDLLHEIQREDITLPMVDHHYVDDEEQSPTCETYGLTSGKHCSICQKVFVEQKPIDPLGHAFDYEHVLCRWTGFEKAEWVISCENNPEHQLVYPAAITTQTENATCTTAGKTTYTAEVWINDVFYQDTKEEILLPLEHQFLLENRVWIWENEAATLLIPCSNDESHVSKYPAEIEKKRIPASCLEDGKEILSASVVIDGITYTDQRETILEASGHSFDMTHIQWNWENDGKATAKVICSNDSTHVKIFDAIIKVDTIPANCLTEGVRIYTATVTIDGKNYTDQKREVIPQTDHEIDYDVYTFEWNDYTSVSLRFVCLTDASHIISIPADIEESVIPATCVHEGVHTYVATATYKDRIYHSQKEVILPINPEAHEYDYEHPIFHWTEAFEEYQASVEVLCKCTKDKLIYSDVNISKTVKENTFEEEGFIEYVASVEIQNKVVQEKKILSLPKKESAQTKEEFLASIQSEQFDVTLFEDIILDDGLILSGSYCAIDLNGHTLTAPDGLLKISCSRGYIKNGSLVSGMNQDLGEYALICEESYNLILDNVSTFGGIYSKDSTIYIRNSLLTATASYGVSAYGSSHIYLENSTIYKNYQNSSSNAFFRIEEGNEIVLQSNLSLFTTTNAVLFEEGISPIFDQILSPKKIDSQEYLASDLSFKCLSLTDDLVLDEEFIITGEKLFLDLNHFTIQTSSDFLILHSKMGHITNGTISSANKESTLSVLTVYDGSLVLEHLILECKVEGENSTISYSDVIMKL